MNSDFFVTNRERLCRSLKSKNAFVVVSQSKEAGDPDADFWYLSGISEPGWQLVIEGGQLNTRLIAPKVSEVQRIFDGGIRLDEAKKISGVDEVLDSVAGEEITKSIGKSAEYKKTLAKLRAIKLPEEIEMMKDACQLTVEALNSVKSKLPDYRYEYQVEADISHHFRWHNATHAFAPIVASGKNACTLHYAKNDTRLKSDALLLIDVGARTQMYAADITRTFAVDQPTARQSSIHMAIQSAQAGIINLVKPGASLKEYSIKADFIMKEALLSVGLMKNSQDESSFRRYYPHAISHGLGIDVHESLGGYKELHPGMMLTVEPGIYIPEEGIGVRIEDDILVTDDGHVNLTAGLSTDL